MDTRKLEVLKCASIDIGNGDGFQEVPELIFPDDKRGGADFHTLGYAFSYEDAAELVTRWNAYPDLVAALDDLMYELKARDEDYDMREPYGRADRLLKSIDADLGDKNE